jgi:hypothetical protein
MLGDLAITLTDDEQIKLAMWALKTAMVVDSIGGKTRPNHFRREEREALRVLSQMPSATTVWVARFSQSSLGSFGTDIGINLPNITEPCNGSVNTIIVGHLVIQSVMARIADYGYTSVTVQTKAGLPWDDMLVRIWPVETKIAQWPLRP